MFGKVKQFLGIEGIKVQLIVPLEVDADSSEIKGSVRLHSKHTQTVTSLELKLVEKYKRGRRKGKLIDEFELGNIKMIQEIEVKPNEPIEVDFELPFELVKSEMDYFGDKNLVTKGVVGVAKFIKNVKSKYRIEVEAKVKGTALHPFDVAEINIL